MLLVIYVHLGGMISPIMMYLGCMNIAKIPKKTFPCAGGHILNDKAMWRQPILFCRYAVSSQFICV